MPLSKSDNPETLKATEADGSPKKVTELAEGDHSATNEAIDAGAGAPEAMRDAAEDLPEGDVVKDAIKAAMLATDAQTEAKEKAKVVNDSSTGAQDTPSGFALNAVKGIADDVKRGEEYARIKSAVRHGTVPADPDDLKARK
jgi:hypothetical protein